MRPEHFLSVVQKALRSFQGQIPYSDHAAYLLLGTALTESGLEAIYQDGGPARGFLQIEPDTMRDIYENFLVYRDGWEADVERLRPINVPPEDALAEDLRYQIVMGRLVYWRSPEPLPDMDAVDMAHYWKANYNTRLGRGTVDHALPHFERALQV